MSSVSTAMRFSATPVVVVKLGASVLSAKTGVVDAVNSIKKMPTKGNRHFFNTLLNIRELYYLLIIAHFE